VGKLESPKEDQIRFLKYQTSWLEVKIGDRACCPVLLWRMLTMKDVLVSSDAKGKHFGTLIQ
jgi:hypothetical protein